MSVAIPPLDRKGVASSTSLTGSGWDLITIAGMDLPGHCRVLNSAGLELKIDEKTKAGAHGQNPTLHGVKPGPLDVEVKVWTDAQLARLLEIVESLKTAMLATPTKTVTTIVPGTSAANSAAQASTTTTQKKTVALPPKPLGIVAPQLAALGITAVIVIRIGELQFASELGVTGRKMTIRFHHWLPPKDHATNTPTGAPKRQVTNNRDPAKNNPKPSTQKGVCGPPAGLALTSG